MKTFNWLLLGLFILNSCTNNIEGNHESQWLFLAGKAEMPSIVFISGDEEYRSEEALPQLAKILNKNHGFNCTVLFAQDSANPGTVNPNVLNNIPGLEQLSQADLMIIFTRFRALPDSQMQHIDNYLMSGKPVIGMRTATHAFMFSDNDTLSKFKHYGNFYESAGAWNGGFGEYILGEKWIAHHGNHKHQSTRGLLAEGASSHPILRGIADGEIWGPTDVYAVRLPLNTSYQTLVLGQVTNRAGKYDSLDATYGMRSTDVEAAGLETEKDENGNEVKINRNDPMMPVAWIKDYQIPGGKKGKVFTTTMGAATDLLSEGTRRMLINAVFWSLGLNVPEKANVDTVGNYNPSAFEFKDDEHWVKKNIQIRNLY
jgi:hypothetical protein